MKKSFLLLTLLWGALSAWAHDAEVNGIFYNLNKANKTATVTFKGDNFVAYDSEYAGDVVIPKAVTYNGITYSITSLGEWCFYGCSSLTSITIPNSVTSLGNFCFECCRSLTSITIPNSVTSLGDGCFRGCSSLASITIPNSVTSLEYLCFQGCSSLTSITIPNSVTSLGDFCFWGCRSLTSITIPNSVTSLGSYCFSCCSSLTSITIPNSVTSLKYLCFQGCSSLTSIYMLPSTPPSTDSGIFYGSPLKTVYVVDENAKKTYKASTAWWKYEIVVKPTGIK